MYTLNITNKTDNLLTFVLFQEPSSANSAILPTAWKTVKIQANATSQISWNMDYSFQCAPTGTLVPGVKFNASQNVPAALPDKNLITLEMDRNFPTLTNLRSDGNGYFNINTAPTIPLYMASVALGVDGDAMFAIQSNPNTFVTFTLPGQKYFVGVGMYSQGMVLQPDVTNNAASVNFANGVDTLDVVLNTDFTWTVSQD